MQDFLPSFDFNPTRGKYPLDNTFSVDQLLLWHSKHSPQHKAIQWCSEGRQSTERPHNSMSWSELDIRVQRVMESILEDLKDLFLQSDDPETRKDYHQYVVGVFATAGVIEYSILLLALLRLTHPRRLPSGVLVSIIPFLISPALKMDATKALLEAMNVKHVYTTSNSTRKVLEEILVDEAEPRFHIHRMPPFGTVLSKAPIATTFEGFQEIDRGSLALILHSSGSTSNPKPIRLTHGILIQWANSLAYDGFLAEDDLFAVHGRPIYHAMGMLAMIWSLANRFPRAVLPPNHKTGIPTDEEFLEQAVSTNATIIYTVPSSLESWATHDAQVETLKRFKAVIYAGAPLSKEAGTTLYSRGVNIRCSVGATEYGQVIHFPAQKFSEGYEWFTLASFTNPHFEPQEEPNRYEIIFKQGRYHALAVIDTEIDGVPAYSTNDVVERHPDNPSLLRLSGRKDDQIALSSGQKVNPVPIEQFLGSREGIKGAVIFGNSQQLLGVIIEPAESTFSPGELNKRIWTAIEATNNAMMTLAHVRILRNMVIIASPEKPFTYTSKNTARRGAIIKEYQPEIKELYASLPTQ